MDISYPITARSVVSLSSQCHCDNSVQEVVHFPSRFQEIHATRCASSRNIVPTSIQEEVLLTQNQGTVSLNAGGLQKSESLVAIVVLELVCVQNA
jgi:hypothetical protein